MPMTSAATDNASLDHGVPLSVVVPVYNEADNVWPLAEWRAMTGQDLDSIVSDPASVFVDETGDDYHLLEGGPAIDTGTSQGAPRSDIEANGRPCWFGIDMGAYEYCDGGFLRGDCNDDGEGTGSTSRRCVLLPVAVCDGRRAWLPGGL